MDGRSAKEAGRQDPKESEITMAMRSTSDSRRLYKRGGTVLLCLSGKYFGPKANERTNVIVGDPAREVKVTVLKDAGGKKRVQIEQIAPGGASIVETWTEKQLTFAKREKKAA